MIHYLAFIDEIGFDGKNYIYRFDFTLDTTVVWGEYFNITPAIIVPNIEPDKNCLSMSFTIKTEILFNIAKKDTCFSLQDCIDGIIPMGFSDNIHIVNKKYPIIFNFGEEYDSVVKKLKENNIEPYDFLEIKTGDDSSINDLINNDDAFNDNETEDDF